MFTWPHLNTWEVRELENLQRMTNRELAGAEHISNSDEKLSFKIYNKSHTVGRLTMQ